MSRDTNGNETGEILFPSTKQEVLLEVTHLECSSRASSGLWRSLTVILIFFSLTEKNQRGRLVGNL
jgi:hypothetical protein